jgi:DNA-binding NarL/FixJ family response regulator
MPADDQPFFRAAAREVIETAGFESVGEAASGEEALRLVDERKPQLVLVDVRMPAMDGVETTRRIKAEHPEVFVVLISIEERANLPSAVETADAELVRKQDFCPALLRSLWRNRAGAAR